MIAGIARLSPQERLLLIGELWDSLSDAETTPSQAQLAELRSRLTTFEQDARREVDWDRLKAELHARTP